MVELTELPEKWCIKREKETWNIITDYFNITFGNTYAYDNWNFPYIHYNGTGDNDSSSFKYDRSTLITFEDFKRLVLKEETKQQEIILW